jgi:ubiquinone/menaquinone biosynthesis C-methylase UbiE
MKKIADKNVNKLYGGIRRRYSDARANGYRFHKYFLREQEIIISTLTQNEPGIVLDIGCGSGLMALPLLNKSTLLLGLDFNEEACKAAYYNDLKTIRGNAFSLPFKKESINNVYCCQFLNQQSHENMILLLFEVYKTLSPKGKLIIIWRNGEALIHRIAHRLFMLYDLIMRQPSFPVINHPIAEVERNAHEIGFETVTKEVIFPLLRWRSNKINSLLSKLIGASFFLVLERK